MAEFPALPLWTDAYLADTAARLTAEEHGVYMLLMQLAWRERGSLPESEDDIITWVKGVCKSMHGRVAKRVTSGVLRKFWKKGDDGRWTQKRLEKEWKRVRNTSETRSKSGQKGNQVRWKNKVVSDRPGIASRARLPYPEPEPEERETNVSCAPAVPAHLPNGLAAEFESEFWPRYPAKVGKKPAAVKFAEARKRHRLETIIAGLEHYIATKPCDRQWLHPTTFLHQERFLDGDEPTPRHLAPVRNGRGSVAEAASRVARRMEQADEDRERARQAAERDLFPRHGRG